MTELNGVAPRVRRETVAFGPSGAAESTPTDSRPDETDRVLQRRVARALEEERAKAAVFMLKHIRDSVELLEETIASMFDDNDKLGPAAVQLLVKVRFQTAQHAAASVQFNGDVLSNLYGERLTGGAK